MNKRVTNFALDEAYSNQSKTETLETIPLFQATLGDLKEIIRMVAREEILESPMTIERTGRQLYGVKAIADALHVSIATCHRHIAKGLYEGAIYNVGKMVVADYDALMAILKCNKELKYWRNK